MFLLVQMIEIMILLILALIGDITTCKIKNHITLTFAALGMITNTAAFGLEGLMGSLSGFFAPVMLLIILYALKMLGAGDIKLFGAIGAIMGYKFAAYSVLYSFIMGGFVGVGFLIARKNTAGRFKYFFNYTKSCVISCNLLEYSDFESDNGSGRFRFTYGIVPGTLLQMILYWTTR